jgi:hypothetical protein
MAKSIVLHKFLVFSYNKKTIKHKDLANQTNKNKAKIKFALE